MTDHDAVPGATSDAVATLEWRFRQFGLPVPPVPPVPETLRDRLTAYGDWAFATCEMDAPRYDVESAMRELLARGQDNLVIAADGYGMGSSALHYFLVLGSLGCFLQLPYDGAGTDETDAAVVADAFAAVTRLSQAVVPTGHTVLVVDSFHLRAWARVRPEDVDDHGEAEVSWLPCFDPLTEAREALGCGGDLAVEPGSSDRRETLIAV